MVVYDIFFSFLFCFVSLLRSNTDEQILKMLKRVVTEISVKRVSGQSRGRNMVFIVAGTSTKSEGCRPRNLSSRINLTFFKCSRTGVHKNEITHKTVKLVN